MNKYIILDTSIMVALNGKPHVIENTHPNFKEIKDRLENDNFDIEMLIDPAKTIEDYSNKELVVDCGVVYYKNIQLHGNITNRIMEMYKKGDDFTFLVNFLKRVIQNPDPKILEQIDKFLKAVNIPIGKDGCLLAYKTVDENYKDIYTHTIDNSVGRIVKVDRKEVDNDSTRGCSHGLHCGNIDYVKQYGGFSNHGTTSNRLIIVRVDPKDIVSVPADCSFQKIRCCEYKVVSEVTWEYLLNTTVQDEINGDNVISVADETPVADKNLTEYEFKVGDKVRVIGGLVENTGHYIGTVGIIESIDDTYNKYPYLVEEEESLQGVYYSRCHLELVEEKITDTPEIGSKWTDKDTKALIGLRAKGMTYDEIGAILGRSANACRKRYNRVI